MKTVVEYGNPPCTVCGKIHGRIALPGGGFQVVDPSACSKKLQADNAARNAKRKNRKLLTKSGIDYICRTFK